MATIELPFSRRATSKKAVSKEDFVDALNREVVPSLEDTRSSLNALMAAMRDTLQPLNAKLFGATGDGTTDDHEALQKAIDAVPAGGTLLVPDGTFIVDSPLVRTSSIRVTGTGTIKRGPNCVGRMMYVHGTAASYVGFFALDGVGFDGSDAGAIVYSLSNPQHEVSCAYVTLINVSGSLFSNTAHVSLFMSNCTMANVDGCRYVDGAPSSGSASETTLFHVYAAQVANLTVDGTTFETDIVYDPGDKTQGGVVAASPTAVFMDRCSFISITGCKSDNAGNFEVYEGNFEAVISGNVLRYPHIGAIKLDNFMRGTVSDNVIIDPLNWWGSAIRAGCYTRLQTYGCLRGGQGNVTIQGNVIKGCRADEGPIIVTGAIFSTSHLDTRITAQGSYGYTTTNVVTKTGSDYFYTDFDGTVYGPIDQKYLTARNQSVCNNTIDGYATTGIYAYLSDSVSMTGNSIANCANIDTDTGFNKTAFKALDCYSVNIFGNTASMDEDTVPTIAGAASYTNGVMVQASTSDFKRVTRARIDGNSFTLNQAGTAVVYVADLGSVSIQQNDMNVLSFLSVNSTFIRADGCNEYGIVGTNRRSLVDTTFSPSASNEYSFLQAAFMAIRFEDDLYSFDVTKRVVSSAADFTNPNQVAAGYYSVGSMVFRGTNRNSTYERCATAGHYAPAYAGGTAYSAGHKVMVAGAPNRFYVALVATTGNAPTGADTDNAYWRWLAGNTLATFATITL